MTELYNFFIKNLSISYIRHISNKIEYFMYEILKWTLRWRWLRFFSTEDILTCHSSKNTGANIKWITAGQHLAAAVSGSWCCAYIINIVNVLLVTHVFLLLQVKKCFEKGKLGMLLYNDHGWRVIYCFLHQLWQCII